MSYMVYICEEGWAPGGLLTSVRVWAESSEEAADRAVKRLLAKKSHILRPYWPEGVVPEVYRVIEMPDEENDSRYD